MNMNHTHTLQQVRILCDPGLEDICQREAISLLPPDSCTQSDIKPIDDSNRTGRFFLKIDTDSLPALQNMRTAYHFIHHLDTLRAKPKHMMEAAQQWAQQAEIPGFYHNKSLSSFRVTVVRRGNHPFISTDLERLVGGVLVEKSGLAVNLTQADFNLRIDLNDSRADIGIQLNKGPMDKRWKWLFRPRVSLRTTIAAAMLQQAQHFLLPPVKATDVQSVLDPFCGSATIGLEASVHFPKASIFCSDNDPEAVAGAEKNIGQAKMQERIQLSCQDARLLESATGVDICCANTPFGVRMGKKLNFGAFYDDILGKVGEIVRPGGVFVLLIGKKRGLFNYVLKNHPEWQQCDARVIEIGGSFPGFFLLRRR